MCDFEHSSNDNEPGGAIRRVVALSRAKKDDLISVAGVQGLEVLGLLCRSGFERVQCARYATCGGADGLSDTLILAGASGLDALSLELEHTLKLLKSGGTLALQLQSFDEDGELQSRLLALGYDIVCTVFDLSHEVLVRHTVSRRSALRQVA